MLSRIRKGASDDMLTLLTTLKGMELNSKYPLERFVHSPGLEVDNNRKKITVRFHNSMPPRIRNKDTQYRYELYLLLPGKESHHDVEMMAGSAWMNADDTVREMVFEYDVPFTVKHYVLCLHFMSGQHRKAMGTLASRG